MNHRFYFKLTRVTSAFLVLLWFGIVGVAFADALGPPSGTVLIVRHAEKPDDGAGLAPAGKARAQAYATYFQHFQLDGKTLTINFLMASTDSAASHRPRSTLKPLAKALGMEIKQKFEDKDTADEAAWLASHEASQVALVCWHHGQLPKLLKHLGADPDALLPPDGKWPEDVYDWVIVLQYDASGHLTHAERIVEQLN